jgi:hypothetical protein
VHVAVAGPQLIANPVPGDACGIDDAFLNGVVEDALAGLLDRVAVRRVVKVGVIFHPGVAAVVVEAVFRIGRLAKALWRQARVTDVDAARLVAVGGAGGAGHKQEGRQAQPQEK